MKILLTFPGQGAQVPQMLHQLPANEMTQQLLSQASAVLGQDVLELDSAEALEKTRAVQLCLLISGVAYARQLQQQGISADFVSGLSIGAFPAAVIAGALTFPDAVRLVALRGQLMEQAYPTGYGLAAILGLPLRQLEMLIAQVNSAALPVYLANINAEEQMVIAGSEAAMAQVMALAKAGGAAKVQRLAVSVPSHCALLIPAAEKLAQAIKQVPIARPQIAYLSGSSGRVLWQPERIADDLAFNMARVVRWHEAMVAAYEREVRLAIEMPPGAVLTGLSKKVMEQGEALSLGQQGLAAVCGIVAKYRRS
ncbi:malonate decarboxylase subunit epsilon [Serratia aquatilis]|uniref:Malonyl CoA-acyl carrier protein transacylase n=1 Tax=Serratia aquatilis TaxID=1737515 RepID=A0ABV6EC46_9GAMM